MSPGVATIQPLPLPKSGAGVGLPLANAGLLHILGPNSRKRDIWTVDNLPARRRDRPLVVLFMGRRGQGKTLSMTALGLLLKLQFQRSRSRRTFHLATNYYVEGADHYDVNLINTLLGFPRWADSLLVLLDEIATAVPSRRSLTSVNGLFSQFLTQIRKRNCAVVFTTQFPQVLDWQVLIQVDLFVRCNLLQGGKAVRLEIFDYWGQWTGNDWRKPWPPQVGTHDWERTLYGLDAIWPKYNTSQVIAPIWLSGKDKTVKGQETLVKEHIPAWVSNPDGEVLDEGGEIGAELIRPQEVEVSLPPVPVVQSKGSGDLSAELLRRPKPVPLLSLMSLARETLGITRVSQLAEWCQANGWKVVRSGKGNVLYHVEGRESASPT